jgi:hypothetical protein
MLFVGRVPKSSLLGKDGGDLGLQVSHDPNDERQFPPSPIPRAPFVLCTGVLSVTAATPFRLPVGSTSVRQPFGTT